MNLPAGWFGAVRAVAARPRLWPAGWRAYRSLVPGRWWTRRPFLPVPDPAWMAFRLTTAYGDPAARIDPDDLVVWLAWSDTVRPRSLLTPGNFVPRPDRAG